MLKFVEAEAFQLDLEWPSGLEGKDSERTKLPAAVAADSERRRCLSQTDAEATCARAVPAFTRPSGSARPFPAGALPPENLYFALQE